MGALLVIVLLACGGVWLGMMLVGAVFGLFFRLLFGLIGGIFSIIGGLVGLAVMGIVGLALLPVFAILLLPALIPVMLMVGFVWLLVRKPRPVVVIQASDWRSMPPRA